MNPDQILKTARELIAEHAGGDPDQWWYANRFVFARLQLDERKTKTAIKKRLLDAGKPCHACKTAFEARRDVCIHRLDGEKGYRDGNCVLMHGECHRKTHSTKKAKTIEQPETGVLTKESMRHENGNKVKGEVFLYWWDIPLNLAASLDQYEAVEFVQKDSSQRCIVTIEDIKKFLTLDRRTTRQDGNWGFRVLKDHENELASEPSKGRKNWLFLPVTWLGPDEA